MLGVGFGWWSQDEDARFKADGSRIIQPHTTWLKEWQRFQSSWSIRRGKNTDITSTPRLPRAACNQ